MKILFDHGTPSPLRKYLSDHDIKTTYEHGWAKLCNGDLINRADAEYQVFVTTDKNLKYQQNLKGRKLAILVLPFASWPRLRCQTDKIRVAINGLQAGDYLELKL